MFLRGIPRNSPSATATLPSSAPAFAAGRRRGALPINGSSHDLCRPRAGRAQGVEHPAPTEIPDMSDFQIADHGTITSIRPLNEAASQWLDQNVVSEPWQWVQGALCV